jgi:hypothetical protein
MQYLKKWYGPLHVIVDPSKQWVVIGWRMKRSRAYRRYKIGPVDLIVSHVRSGREATDIWLRYTWAGRK